MARRADRRPTPKVGDPNGFEPTKQLLHAAFRETVECSRARFVPLECTPNLGYSEAALQ